MTFAHSLTQSSDNPGLPCSLQYQPNLFFDFASCSRFFSFISLLHLSESCIMILFLPLYKNEVDWAGSEPVKAILDSQKLVVEKHEEQLRSVR